jgi:myo-inositol-1-phosphate synthase
LSNNVRVAIIGVGNCAAALVQGVHHYSDTSDEDAVTGLMHSTLGEYHVSDIEFSAAFDVDSNKVGRDLSEAMFVAPNNTIRFAEVPHLGVPVSRGMTHDGFGRYYREVTTKAPGPTSNVVKILRETGTDVVVNFLPVGSEMATKWYVEQVLDAECAFVNCIPVFIAREQYWQGRFSEAGLPVIGDDVKSQVGATIVHRVLTRLFRDRGVRVDRTYQLNFGGNMDFYNMLEAERLVAKKTSKRDAVVSQLDHPISPENVHISPSDYVAWLTDRKFCHIRMEGTGFGDAPLNLELKLEVWDSPNSAGVVIDALRCAKIALDRGVSGAVEAPSAYFMKSPPVQYTDAEALGLVEEFIAGSDGHRAQPSAPAQAIESDAGSEV